MALARKGYPARDGSRNACLSAAVLLSIGTLMVFPCVCGHLDAYALPSSAVAAGLACYAVAQYPRPTFKSQLVAWGCVFLVLMVFGKNLCDILWFGHVPLLR